MEMPGVRLGQAQRGASCLSASWLESLLERDLGQSHFSEVSDFIQIRGAPVRLLSVLIFFLSVASFIAN